MKSTKIHKQLLNICYGLCILEGIQYYFQLIDVTEMSFLSSWGRNKKITTRLKREGST